MRKGSRSHSAVRSGCLHELSIAESVVRIASRQADGRRVTKVQMKVGYLRQVVPSALTFGFGLLAEGTPVEGDVQTTLDADRLARFHIPLVQVNTDPGFGGECHLDANMVRSGLGELPLEDIDILIIENVGNLVCPAEFRVGEDVRVMVYSITEGEEKPLKYPLMFRSADLVLVNKADLLEHLDFDLEQFLGNLDAVNPGVRTVLTSARTGQGVDEWCDWLGQRLENA